jgi:hypothetical protein
MCTPVSEMCNNAEVTDNLWGFISELQLGWLQSKGKVLRHEGVWENGCLDPYFLDRGSSWEGSGQPHAPAA